VNDLGSEERFPVEVSTQTYRVADVSFPSCDRQQGIRKDSDHFDANILPSIDPLTIRSLEQVLIDQMISSWKRCLEEIVSRLMGIPTSARSRIPMGLSMSLTDEIDNGVVEHLLVPDPSPFHSHSEGLIFRHSWSVLPN
jgi:hypothetical protein